MKVTQSAPTLRQQVAALDGLRGAAILAVLLFHTGHLSGGFLGVDLFFALSGYLITDLLLREVADTGVVSLIAFWGRRVRRLLPALSVMLLGTSLLVWSLGTPDLLRNARSDGPWVQANLINWHLLAESANYWDRFGPTRVFEHLWSIAVEEQFYLVWPVLVLVIAHYGRQVQRRVAVLAATASVVSLGLMITLVSSADPTRVYTGTDTRAFSLLLGALVATAPVRDALAQAVDLWAGAVMALLALGITTSWVLVDGTHSVWLFTGGLFLHSLAAAVLIGLCVHAPTTAVASALAWKPLRWLGLISYSVYLWHWPIVVLLSARQPELDDWTAALIVSTTSVVLAVLSKYLVEDPIRFRAGWARGRSGLLAFAAVMVGLAALWLLLPTPAPVTIDLTDLT